MVPSTGSNKLKAAVFISGAGSNLKSLINNLIILKYMTNAIY